jgi:hypothetical protein
MGAYHGVCGMEVHQWGPGTKPLVGDLGDDYTLDHKLSFFEITQLL